MYSHGPALAGTFCNVTLFGILLSQAFFYFTTFTRDKLGIKLFVAILLLADTVNCVFDIWWIYDILVNRFGTRDPSPILYTLWHRWYYVATNHHAVGGIGTAIAIRFIPEFTQYQRFRAVVIVWLISAAACDTAITISLTWNLRRHKTGFAATDRLVDKIIRTTVQNGLITSIWAIMDLVVYLSTVTIRRHLAFNFPLGKLYSCTLMSTLNSRAGGGYERSRIIASTTDSLAKVNCRSFWLVLPSLDCCSNVQANVLTYEQPRITNPEVSASFISSDPRMLLMHAASRCSLMWRVISLPSLVQASIEQNGVASSSRPSSLCLFSPDIEINGLPLVVTCLIR
ncbi:hypothetical protein PUNSTDRAFT_68337 [Punctularia strigosozonata HHB-11173 SS5]|uniref:uncharacterized protein n=1 Tax=Punctularia strigosozonata (strain HHB-11173) TaxID=741275 RepID=UPI0004417C13|nr:uncharacterized protein PUNSTDRAFT_68337 [Punctularia strigosozonata HHB-11173 SS5]EIN08873.1 hypothetical protein PUNSTDRAFT_68337 [Punctularia strigosozonata HHB-11173 SS5]